MGREIGSRFALVMLIWPACFGDEHFVGLQNNYRRCSLDSLLMLYFVWCTPFAGEVINSVLFIVYSTDAHPLLLSHVCSPMGMSVPRWTLRTLYFCSCALRTINSYIIGQQASAVCSCATEALAFNGTHLLR